jgi:hypothetical protein
MKCSNLNLSRKSRLKWEMRCDLTEEYRQAERHALPLVDGCNSDDMYSTAWFHKEWSLMERKCTERAYWPGRGVASLIMGVK